jgi:hypothetical protein
MMPSRKKIAVEDAKAEEILARLDRVIERLERLVERRKRERAKLRT